MMEAPCFIAFAPCFACSPEGTAAPFIPSRNCGWLGITLEGLPRIDFGLRLIARLNLAQERQVNSERFGLA